MTDKEFFVKPSKREHKAVVTVKQDNASNVYNLRNKDDVYNFNTHHPEMPLEKFKRVLDILAIDTK